MNALQRQASAVSSVALVLLLYLFATGIAEVLARSGLDIQWRQSVASGVLCIAGVTLVSTHAYLWRSEACPNLVGGVIVGALLATLMQVVHAFALLAYLPASWEPTDSQLPPFARISVELMLGAISEELLFTVFLYSIFKQRMRVGLAAASVVLFFVAMHRPGSVVAVLGHVLYMACALALFQRYRSIAMNIAFHLATNALSLALTLRVADSSLFQSPLATHAKAVSACLFALQLLVAVRVGWGARSTQSHKGARSTELPTST